MNKIYILFFTLFFSMLISNSGVGSELEPIFPGYPVVFSGKGQLDLISKEENRMVIDDSGITLQPSTTFHTQGGESSVSHFHKGDTVGILLKKGTRQLLSVWLIKSGGVGQAPPIKTTGSKNKRIRQEGGVWKN